MEERVFKVVLAGNPNVGKSTVFNALTGLRQHTGNWPGKTVESARGTYQYRGARYELTDVPGAYSLAARSPDEEAAFTRVCLERADAIVVICDASALARNLNLALQILERSARVVVCVNLLDEAKRRNLTLDLPLLEQRLGVPVVGTCAREKRGLDALREAIARVAAGAACAQPVSVRYPEAIETSLSRLMDALLLHNGKTTAPADERTARWLALRLLERGIEACDAAAEEGCLQQTHDEACAVLVAQERDALAAAGFGAGTLRDAIVSSVYRTAEALLLGIVCSGESRAECRQLRADRLLTGRLLGVPAMLLLLFLVFYLTIAGANAVSDRLATALFWFEDVLRALFAALRAPAFLSGLLLDGAYRALAWVVSVMLPPMAIFFPLFTLLEDLGYLPRVAFNLDRPFRRCGGCGRQALTMCMGFGCNAAGVTGCRIIDSPRERLIAMLTNAFVPCNGRFPALITLLGLFLAGVRAGGVSPLASAALLTLSVLLGVGVTFLVSLILSKTLLRGLPSSFTLELPPYRRPQIGRVIVRSVLDRTLFVLGRAAAVAAPAGLVIWLVANVTLGGASLFAHLTALLDPFGRFFGMDGTILTAFLLGLPANEIVLPLAAMGYAASGTLSAMPETSALGALLSANGWSAATALCTAAFMLFHWPCSTTILTLYRETRSRVWTVVGVLLPTLAGLLLCLIVRLAFFVFA